MPAYYYNGQQVINIGDEVPVKIAKVEEKTMTAQEAIEELKSRRMCAAYVGSDYVDSVDINALDMAICALEKQLPAADVRPVVHGHWERSFWFVTCSVCGYTSADTDDEGSDIALNFCPDCGADMREEKNTG